LLHQLDTARADQRGTSAELPTVKHELIPVFIINLEKDKDRRDLVLNQFAKLPGFKPKIVQAVYGRLLSENVCEILTQEKNWANHKGTIGCFLSHVKAWEEVSRASEPFAVVLEDDADATGLRRLASLTVPDDAEIVFINDRMSPAEGPPAEPTPLPIGRALQKLDAERGGPGGDGYLLTPGGARKLLAACLTDFYYGHVDGRLLRYATTERDIAMVPEDAWIARVIKYHRHPTLIPALGLLRGYCLSSPLVRHLGIASIREAENLKGPEDATTSSLPAVRPLPAESRARPGLPIRYWNFVRNAGDQINPYIFETVAERTPYFAPQGAEHVLGIGSVFFMATPQSHIWGSGILDPNADCSQVVLSKVHAVRGKLTYGILKDRDGLSRAVPLGDPGIFADEIAEIRAYLPNAQVKRRVGLIPHHGLTGHKYIQEMAKQPDVSVINPRLGCIDFIKEIIASEIIVSQSLHGIIFAQTFGKPFVWLSHSSDETWLFKFHDWFSMTADAPQAPAMFGTSFASLLGQARPREHGIDKAALRAAFPDVPPGDRTPGIGFREVRRLAPISFRITGASKAPVTSNYDETIVCEKGDEAFLQNALQERARAYDDSFNGLLVFDELLFSKFTVSEIEAYRTMLDELPDVHYLLIVPEKSRLPEDRDESDGTGGFATMVRRRPAHDWQGVVLARNPYGFSFSARGRVLFRYGA
jgi:Glycosyltransferase family 25 (LPS biosynthesis protein)/Polysaccharide pyruvyl transferase